MNKPKHEKDWARKNPGTSASADQYEVSVRAKKTPCLRSARKLRVRKKFEGVGEISEGRTRSAETVRRLAEMRF